MRRKNEVFNGLDLIEIENLQRSSSQKPNWDLRTKPFRSRTLISYDFFLDDPSPCLFFSRRLLSSSVALYIGLPATIYTIFFFLNSRVAILTWIAFIFHCVIYLVVSVVAF